MNNKPTPDGADAFVVPQWAKKLLGEAEERAPVQMDPWPVEPPAAPPVAGPRVDVFRPADVPLPMHEAHPPAPPKRGGWPKGKPRK